MYMKKKEGSMKDKELKRCPFCGNKDVYIDSKGIFGIFYHKIKCFCGRETCYSEDRNRLIKAWNTRKEERG